MVRDLSLSELQRLTEVVAYTHRQPEQKGWDCRICRGVRWPCTPYQLAVLIDPAWASGSPATEEGPTGDG